MNIKKLNILNLVICLLLTAVMFIFILFTAGSVGISAEDTLLTALLFSALYLGCLCYFAATEQKDLLNFLFIAAAAAALIFMRVALLSHPARDYNVFLSDWLYKMRELEGVQPLVQKIGDYNMPYLYFLFIISKFNLNDLILIKWFSCIFDVIAAIFMMKLVALKWGGLLHRFSAFIITLSLPTVLLNSSYWGQCDSILAALCIGAVYLMLKGKTGRAVVLYALAFSFKLQAIFMLPFMVIAFIVKKANPLKILLFPAVFGATLLPALLAGRSLINCVRIYFDQASQYAEMTLNAPSLWQLFGSAPVEQFNMVAIMLTGIVAISFIFICLKFKDNFDLSALITAAYLSAVLLPFFLPRMHDRYFFIADILSLAVFFFDKKKWYVPLITVLASLNCYTYYLFGGFLILPYTYLTIALLTVISITTISFVKKIQKP